MGTESKGRAWFGKIFNKLETILVEVDTFTSQSTLCLNLSDLPELNSVRGEPKEVAEEHYSGTSNVQQDHDRVASPSCKSPSDPPSHQNFDISGHVRVEERVQGNIFKENLVQGDSFKENLSASLLSDGKILTTSPLLEECCDASLTSATTLGVEEQIITVEESQITNTLIPQKFSSGGPSNFPGEEMADEVRVESCRDVVSSESPSSQSSLECFGTVLDCNDDTILAALGISTDDSNLNPLATMIPDVPVQDNVANMRSSNADNPDDVINGKSDIAPLETNASYGAAFREDPSDVDDNALYAVRVRTKKLRSFKKDLGCFNFEKRREKEYEQLAIWFGDADMGSDLTTEEDSKQVEAMDSKSSQVLESEDSQWEIL